MTSLTLENSLKVFLTAKITVRLPNGKRKRFKIDPHQTKVKHILTRIDEFSLEEKEIKTIEKEKDKENEKDKEKEKGKEKGKEKEKNETEKINPTYGLFHCFQTKRRDIFDDFEGEFVGLDQLIHPLSNERLEIRPNPPKTFKFKITPQLRSNQLKKLTYNSNKNISEIVRELPKQNITNGFEIGIVAEKRIDLRNYPPFLPLEIEDKKDNLKKALKKVIKKTQIFGLWLDAKNYKVENYLSCIRPLGYLHVGVKPLPIVIYLNLKGETLYPLIIDPIINVRILIHSVRRYFNIHRHESNKKYNFVLFHVIFENPEEAKKISNGKNIKELILLKPNKSLYEQFVVSGSQIKFVRKSIQNDKSNKQENNNNKKTKSKEKASGDKEEKTIQLKKDKSPFIHFEKTNNLIDDFINLWEEIGSDTLNLVWETKVISDPKTQIYDRIKAASLNRTISILTSPKIGSNELLAMFLEMLIIVEQDLTIQKLFERFNVPKTHPRTQHLIPVKSKRKVQNSVLKILITLLLCSEYLLSRTNKERIKEFINPIIQKYNEMKNKKKNVDQTELQTERNIKFCKKIVQLIDQEKSQNKSILSVCKLIDLEFYETLKSTFKEPEPYEPKEQYFTKLHLLNIHSLEAARQLSFITFQIFKNISFRELYDNAWASNDKLVNSPNVIKLIDKFNRISEIIASQILSAENTKKRVKMIERAIQIAIHLRSLNNFEDLLAIISGLSSSPIIRLKSCWKKVKSEHINIFKHMENEVKLDDPEQTKKLFQNMDLPTIPYLGFYLTEANYASEMRTKTEKGLLNWRKAKAFWRIVENLKKFQIIGYKFKPIKKIHDFFLKSPVLEENRMWEISVTIEPIKENK
ncbi:guanine nucleotide exchange factor [Anaeramoeba flamelloides]|uniref:Guanine nucleotide exchange factor n=1 Tax=Anaeramoeba flamelloides TaxID=1746091 RepID=A0ABQ8XPW2_9EUKA|nr:guanine nucleotide exchange factor [Anaeramoeba flamelloides]